MHFKNIAELIVRLTANFIRKFRLFLVAGLLPLTLAVGGCATQPTQPRTHGYKWICTGTCAIPFRQADAKCTAQANAVVGTDWSYKYRLRNDCIGGEGWEEVSCVLANDPDCK